MNKESFRMEVAKFTIESHYWLGFLWCLTTSEYPLGSGMDMDGEWGVSIVNSSLPLVD